MARRSFRLPSRMTGKPGGRPVAAGTGSFSTAAWMRFRQRASCAHVTRVPAQGPFARCAKNALGPAIGRAKPIPEKPRNFTQLPAHFQLYVRRNPLDAAATVWSLPPAPGRLSRTRPAQYSPVVPCSAGLRCGRRHVKTQKSNGRCAVSSARSPTRSAF